MSGSQAELALVTPTRWIVAVFLCTKATSGVICPHNKIVVRQARGPFPKLGKFTTDDKQKLSAKKIYVPKKYSAAVPYSLYGSTVLYTTKRSGDT